LKTQARGSAAFVTERHYLAAPETASLAGVKSKRLLTDFAVRSIDHAPRAP
jgi:hypothetical protein